jgi:hemolysin activation/secretion protein
MKIYRLQPKTNLKNHIVILASLLVSTCPIHQAYAELALPDAGTVIKELPNLQPDSNNNQRDQNFFQQTPEQHNFSQDQTPIFVRSITLQGNTIFDTQRLHTLVKSIENKNNTLADLQRATQGITQFYHQHGYFLARAYLPKQQMDQGILTINILEGTLGQVSLHNQSKVKNATLQQHLKHIPLNEPFKDVAANKVLLLISDLSGIGEVQASLQAGELTGQTQLNVNIAPAPLFRGRIGFDNQGSTYTGQYRLSSYIESHSLLGYGEKISAQLLSSNQDLLSGNLSGQIPLLGNGLTLGASVGRTQYQLGKQFSILDAQGTSENINVNLGYPVIRSQNLNAHLNLNLDYRKLSDEIAATETKTDKNASISRINLSIEQRDHYGLGKVRGGLNQLDVTISTGKLDIQSPSALRIDQFSAKTHGSFQKYEFSLGRQQSLSEHMSASVQFYGQLSSKNLDSSEKFSFRQMRAYPASEGLGDQGWGSSLNLYYQINPAMNLYLFQDAGKTFENKKAYLQEKNSRYLASTGIGFTGSNKQFMYNTTIGWRNTGVAVNDRDKNPRILAQIGWLF